MRECGRVKRVENSEGDVLGKNTKTPSRCCFLLLGCAKAPERVWTALNDCLVAGDDVAEVVEGDE